MIGSSVLDAQIDAELVHAAKMPDFRAWLKALERVGGCASPIYLIGHTITRDAATGAVLHVFDSADQPGGRLMVACGNRRASRCEPCAWIHQGDTYQLIVAGLSGGKGVPETVAAHPRVFATLTAPSFGSVHRAGDPGKPHERCRPVGADRCGHGNPVSCVLRHGDDDLVVGTPLCPACYDYTHAALWNGHASALWDDFAKRLRRQIAAVAGIPRSKLGEHLRVSFAKVAEYQRRGAIHLHAVIRLDGPNGADQAPPDWATAELLTDAVKRSARSALLNTTRPDGAGLVLRFGRQIDVKPIRRASDGDELTAAMVAGYVAKYVTKGDIPGLVLDAAVRTRGQIEAAPLTEHGRTLALACWDLGRLPECASLRLHSWAHQLGWRGHVATKSRVYSTTYTALKQARVEHRRARDGGPAFADRETVTVAFWEFDQAGHGNAGEAMFAAGIAEDRRLNREIAREALTDLRWQETDAP